MRTFRHALLVFLSLASPLGASEPRVIDLPGMNAHSSLRLGCDGWHCGESPFWTTVDGTVWFAASSAPGREEVWKSDGTPEGTIQVTAVGGILRGHADGPYLGSVNGHLVYAGYDSQRRLFSLSTNGGMPETLMSLSRDPYQDEIVLGPVLDGYLYFAANFHYSDRGFDLYRTDGTPAGTEFADLYPGSGSALSNGTPLIEFEGAIWFHGKVFPDPHGLYRTDGTSVGTRYVRPGTPLGTVNGRLIYMVPAADGKTFELWSTDGVDGVLLQDGLGLGLGLGLLSPAPVANRLLLRAHSGSQADELWATDGSPAGTERLEVGSRGIEGSKIVPGGAAGGKYFFELTNAQFGETSCRSALCATGGTTASTACVICLDAFGSTTDPGIDVGGRYYLTVSGTLMSSDGSYLGTRAEIEGNRHFSLTTEHAATLGDARLLLPIWTTDFGFEPGSTDGTLAGTRVLKNIGSDQLQGSYPGIFRAADDRVFLTATVDQYPSVVVSDGTQSGTRWVELPQPYSIVDAVISEGRYFFIQRSIGDGSWLGVTDGTLAGTNVLPSAGPGTGPLPGMGAVRGGVFYYYYRGGRTDLYFSDGTTGGTRVVLPDVYPRDVVVAAGGMAWVAGGDDVWRTDGTPEGTTLLKAANGSNPNPVAAAVFGANVYVLSADPKGLWRTSTTGSALEPVAAFGPSPNSIYAMYAGEDYLYVIVGGQVWRSDGTEAGTVSLPAMGSRCGASVAMAGNTLYWFTENEAKTVLWRTDGDPETTSAIAEFSYTMPLYPPQNCASLALAQGKLYFPAWSEGEGMELWASDGAPSGTALFKDLWPGMNGSSPAGLTVAGDRIYFSAALPLMGRELWIIDASGAVRRRSVRH